MPQDICKVNTTVVMMLMLGNQEHVNCARPAGEQRVLTA